MDEFATPEAGPYCIAIQLDPELGSLPDGHIDGLGAIPKTYAGALFRVRRVVTNVRKLYYHNLETDYENSFELVEDQTYETRDLKQRASEPRTTSTATSHPHSQTIIGAFYELYTTVP